MYLFFDTETTGLPKDWKAPVSQSNNWPRMVQIAWLIYDAEGRCIEEKNYIIRPENYEIPDELVKIHGISTAIARAEGADLAEVLNEFSQKVQESGKIVAHNFSFDEKIVGAEFYRKNIIDPLGRKPQVCTMRSTIEFCKLPNKKGPGFKFPRLSELHQKLFGTDFEGAHNALSDVRATAKCFFELKKKNFPGL